MRPRVKNPCVPPILRVDFERTIFPHRTWNGVGAYAAQTVGYLLRISERSKKGLRPCGRKRWEEILQIEAQHDMLAHMRRRKSDNRASFDEPLGGRVGGDPIEDRG